MKFLFFVLCISSFTHAQPGDIMAMQKQKMQRIEAALQNDPNNMSLVWERLELTFKPHFDLYKRPAVFDGFQNRIPAYPYYILEDLNYLIDNNISIPFKKSQISLANFYHKRGQFYYLSGYPDYALEDYLIALENNPPFKLKQKICLAIAAYYYNLDENYSLENYEKALSYIDLVTPKENFDAPLIYERYSSRNGDYFEREKIQLLKAAKKEERLVTYLKCIAKSDILFYENERKKSISYQQSHSYTIKISLQYGLQKLYEIASYFYENGNYEKAKEVIEKVILFIPKNTKGHTYETYAYGNYFLLLSNIYGTTQFQNSELEIEHLLKGFGDPTQGFPSQATKQYKRLEALLYKYPYHPKLHLAKAIYLKKVTYNGSYVIPDGNIFTSLRRSESLGLKDYRIHYLRALVLREEKKYAEALVAINKAEVLCTEFENIHRLKLYLLHNIEGSSKVTIHKTKTLFEASKIKEKVNIVALLEMIATL